MKKLSIISLSALILLAGCSGNSKKDAAVGENQVANVKVAAAKMESVDQIVDFTGSVEAFLQNDITPSLPVRIDEILVEVGDQVKKGQLLVKMDMAQSKQSKIQLENLEKEYKRLVELHKAGGVSQQQLDQIKAQLDVARTSYNNLQENTQMKSPLNGVITGRYYHPGEMFSMSPTKSGKAAILTVMELAPLKILINVSEEYFPKLQKGMKTDVLLDIYPDEVFEGKVHLIYPTIDPATRTFTVEISIENKDMKVRPGMFCRVRLNFGKEKHVVVSDLSIVKQTGTNDRYVFVVANGVASKKLVKVGRQLADRVEILDGIKEGDQIITAGHTRLLDQAKVNVVQ